MFFRLPLVSFSISFLPPFTCFFSVITLHYLFQSSTPTTSSSFFPPLPSFLHPCAFPFLSVSQSCFFLPSSSAFLPSIHFLCPVFISPSHRLFFFLFLVSHPTIFFHLPFLSLILSTFFLPLSLTPFHSSFLLRTIFIFSRF